MAARKKPGKSLAKRIAPPRELQPRHLAVFLAALEQTGHVTGAAATAGIARQRFYERREVDEEFAEAWDVALERGIAAVEAEVRRRAIDGVAKPVLHQGALVYVWYSPDGRLLAPGEETEVEGAVRSPLVVHEYSDRLLEMLAKAHNPIYRDRDQQPGISFGDGAKVVLLPGTAPSIEAWNAMILEHDGGKTT